MSTLLDGKHAVVTGGGRGIGPVIARELARHGARLTLIGLEAEPIERTCAELAGIADVYGCQVDIGEPDSVSRAFAAIHERTPQIDILVNNAGIGASRAFLKTDLTMLNRIMNVNLNGTFLCTQAALPGMIARGAGRIVNLASMTGVKGYRYATAYCASKHAVVGLTRALALELARSGITVNAVCPGIADTDMGHEAVDQVVRSTGKNAAEAQKIITAFNPQGRFVKPGEVANAVAWLCLPGSESITGQTIMVSGGEI
jgi:NAD(P)-dependent dehydrogenase (short-subunit alcohol dehydrogenase family)